MIRVAILGGGIGAQHFAAYQALPDWEVCLLVDQDAARRASFPCPGSAEIEDALASDADVIDICLPPALHAPVARAALEVGKHVIVEKPMATSLTEADTLQTPARVFPVFQYRFGPAFAALRALDAAGHLGAPRAAALETHWSRDAAYYSVPWRGTWAGEQGGCLVTHAIHAHDLLAHLMGPITSVTARTATLVNPIETEDSAALLLTLASGALATSSVTLAAATDETRLRLVWEHLTATSDTPPYAPGTGAWTFTARDPANQPEIDAVINALPQAPAGFEGFLTEVSKAIRGESNAAPSFQDGRASLELATAAYHSARTGAAQTLPLPPDHPLNDGWQPRA